MELTKQPVTGFLDAVRSDAPAPGGGSAAALEGAMGAALTAMVCGLTLGKVSCAEHHTLAAAVKTEAESLSARLTQLVDRDTEGFLTISAAYAMPKATAEEKAARSAAIQAGLAVCTEIPLEVMALAVRTLELADSLLGRFNQNATSDLGVAALSLGAAVRGAWLNVLINIGSLRDREKARAFWQRGGRLLERGDLLSDHVYRTICGDILPQDFT